MSRIGGLVAGKLAFVTGYYSKLMPYIFLDNFVLFKQKVIIKTLIIVRM